MSDAPSNILIRGCTVLDGTGAEPHRADIAISAGRIAAVGELGPAAAADRVIDAKGLFAAPGFIDMHGHSDTTALADRRCLSKLFQGITTEACGQCGMTPYPVPENRSDEFEALMSFAGGDEVKWTDARGYLAELGRQPLGINLVPFLGANAVAVWAEADFGLNSSAAAEIAGRAREHMIPELAGLSMGIAYEPLARWHTDALRELAALADGRVLAVHMRNEGARLCESIRECLQLIAGRPIRLEIAHLKSSGRGNWGKIGAALELIQAAASAGFHIGFNAYPYTAGSTSLASTLPDWLMEDGQAAAVRRLSDPTVRQRLREDLEAYRRGERASAFLGTGPDNILIAEVASDENRWMHGLSLAQIAARLGKDPLDAAVDLLIQEKGRVNAVFFTMHEDDVRRALAHPLGCLCTDAAAVCPDGPTSRAAPHPRAYGAFPRFLGKFVRDEGIVSWPEAVRKCTSLPAARLGLADRGVIKPGAAADIVVFDPAEIADRAEYGNPHQLSVGVRWLLVNGVISIAGGEFTGKLGGRPLPPQSLQPKPNPATPPA